MSVEGHERRSRITRHTSGLRLTVDRCGLTRADPRSRLIASLGGTSFRDERLAVLTFPPRFPGFASWLRSRGAFGVASHCSLSVWTLDQFECGNVGAFRPRLQYSPADFTGYVAAMRH